MIAHFASMSVKEEQKRKEEDIVKLKSKSKHKENHNKQILDGHTHHGSGNKASIGSVVHQAGKKDHDKKANKSHDSHETEDFQTKSGKKSKKKDISNVVSV